MKNHTLQKPDAGLVRQTDGPAEPVSGNSPDRYKVSNIEEVLACDGRLVYTNAGDSMLPLIRQGRDLLIIERKKEGRLKKYDIPLYRRDNGQMVLHRIIRVRKEDYVLCGDNRWICETGITDRHIIGILTAVARNGKTLPMTSRRQRIYAHLWCDMFPVRAGFLRSKAFLKRRWRNFKNNA